MRRLYATLAFFSFFLILFVSCYYDNEEALYPSINTACDTTNVTFNTTIVSILNNNCWTCHSNSQAAANGNNIRLQNYADVVAMSVNISGAIKWQAPYSHMPKNSAPLKDCAIKQFDIWVRNGMTNN